jgi:RimJ/RimL family protein N-acetyltransferase
VNALRLSDGVVVLDGHTLADVAAHLEGEDPEQARRFGWHPRRSTTETVTAAIVRWQEQWGAGGPVRAFAVRSLADDGMLAGGCELRLGEDARAQLSYWTFPSFRGRGFAVRVVNLATQWAFAELGVQRAELQVEPDNEPSLAVARKAGFTREGVLRSHAVIGCRRSDMVSWSRLPSDPGPPQNWGLT